jgi:8-hydroxy-5-deazaflavin:NADPH oxidoreductase
MKVAILGTGMVGQAHAGKLAELGHDVLVGTRSPADKEIKGAKVVTFEEAARHGEIILEAINGEYVVKTLKTLADQLAGKILIDISNALDFSGGEVRITTVDGPSLGEQIQKVLPDTKVIKAFNTMNAGVQIDPNGLAGGDHHLFIAGDDQAAKDKFSQYAKDWYGWQKIMDIGDIKAARGMEMLMPFWLDLRKKLGHSNFNYKIVQ